KTLGFKETTIYTGFCIGSPNIYDITPQFVHTLNTLLSLDTEAYTSIAAPFAARTKTQILSWAKEYAPTTPWHLSYSCFMETYYHCGLCPACLRRKEAFKNNEME